MSYFCLILAIFLRHTGSMVTENSRKSDVNVYVNTALPDSGKILCGVIQDDCGAGAFSVPDRGTAVGEEYGRW